MRLQSHYGYFLRRAAGIGTIGAACAAALSGGCGPSTSNNRNSEGGSDSSSKTLDRLTQGSVDAVDILLAVDNSRSMADKQKILGLAIPDLILGLSNPRCVDDNGVPAGGQPASPLDPCPAGTKREFPPVTDIHIGVISSSLGSHGADTCSVADKVSCPGGTNVTNNDKGHLLSRTDPCKGGVAQTYSNKGFLAWDPAQKLAPPGEGDIQSLAATLKDMVKGVGEVGCGFESQLESWYRFLVDPEPYDSISIVNNLATPSGSDATLLQQRADFLRPDSLVTILVLSDENDCSIRESGQFYFAAQAQVGGTAFHLPRARAVCAQNPNDPCCASCGQDAPGCPADPTCTDGNGKVATLTGLEDAINMRCFDQKRRFGIDFLYPIDRYTQAITSNTVANREGTLVPNPLYVDLNPADERSTVRGPGMVYLAAIVGVPWQDIARDKNDLNKGFKSSDEMLAAVVNGMSTWDVILGDPASYVKPADPHMIESLTPRQGLNPITGDAIAPAGAPNGTNSINGHEYTTSTNDDLQYACIFPLMTPRDCAIAGATPCDCPEGDNNNPLCEPTDLGDPLMTRTYQVAAKAYPGIRELALVKSLGDQGIAGSICAQQVDDPSAASFGYRPSIGAVVERLKNAFVGQCLGPKLSPYPDGSVVCEVVEARKVDAGSVDACNACDVPGRETASADVVADIKAKNPAQAGFWNCFCSIKQLEEGDLAVCQSDINNPPINPDTGKPPNGWCYVDAEADTPLGNAKLVENCKAGNKRILRFVGAGEAMPGASLFVACEK